MSKVEKVLARHTVSETGCHLWTGGKNRGYGHACIDKRRVYVHRLSYEQNIGPIPLGMLVCHSCDNRSCINPQHFFLGTHQDNSSDMVAKGRSRGVGGERHYKTRLTKMDVDVIRADVRSSYKIAAERGVSPSTIRMIKTGRHWR